MDNYGNQKYNNPYGYLQNHRPPHPQNVPYQPSASSAYPSYPPYNPPHSYPYPLQPPPYSTSSPPSPTSHSATLEYQYPPPQPHSSPCLNPFGHLVPPAGTASSPRPTLIHHGSFHCSISHYHYPQSGLYPPSETYPHLLGHQHQESTPGSGAGHSAEKFDHFYPPALYPPSDMPIAAGAHFTDNHSTMPPLPLGYPTLSRNSSSSDCWESAHSRHIVPFLDTQTNKVSFKVLLLHGDLVISVKEAKNLPNMDMFHKTIGDMLHKLPGNMTSKIEGRISHKITSDPYVSISLTSAVLGRTFVISNSENPVWNQQFNVPVAHYAAEVIFVVKDSDIVGSQLIGSVSIPVDQIYSGEKVEGNFPILHSNGRQCKPGAVLSISIQYFSMEKLSIYHHGVGAGPDYNGVPGTYFPLRRGGTVTLYQDALVPDGCLPNVKIDQETNYVHGKCWHDIFDAIRQARRLVYITGWSVWHKVRLVRSASHTSDHTLGELLKSKSQEGVRVLLLVWDDPTSRNILGYRTEVETIYTHHQKTVIVDADAGDNRRKIVAFVGGLDLCDGRYDTPHHSLFRTLQTAHMDDYHNPCFAGNAFGCPREPWHDLHCKIDGPAAYDILTNYQERWFKASKRHGIKKLKKMATKMSYDDALLRIERIPDIIGISDCPSHNENDHESWHVQVFRSIDSNSVKGFPKDPKDGTNKNLVCGKNILIDMSIHTAYVKAIRAAQHFIYIENQYFIGSSYNWSSHKDLGANNLIPMEIALKIAEKIRAHERFAAYIVIPMWPEGIPTGAATQRILFWQHKTMQMMYETIYKALVEVGLEGAFVPQDFLNFFCLGNREPADRYENANNGSPAATNTPQALSRKNRRFMIYVHSKGMIVDDEYIILGSANINQRSMDGTRDSEIAMGAYQPHHTWARKLSGPRGQIHGFRMSLWTEHIGTTEDCFTQPETIECVRSVRMMGEKNWKQYASDEVTEMRGHLMKYPVEVDRKGKVRPLPGCETFPDLGGNIVGSFIAIQENLTI